MTIRATFSFSGTGASPVLKAIGLHGRGARATMILPILFTLLSVASAAPTTTPAKGQKPHEAIGQQGCVREECHASIRAYAVVHGPVGVNACDACHELTDAESHTFKFAREKADMCTYCHETNYNAMPVVHKPVKLGECLGCHDPHGGTTKALVREKSIQELCNRCHESVTKGKPILHTPVKEGACDSCHPPHASRFPKLLDVAGPDLCLACHDGFDASLKRAKFTHKALEQGCQKCHDPHGSKNNCATTQPIREQCSNCHEKIALDAKNARYPHTPVSDDKSCINCHTPHGGSMAKLVSDVPATLCMECHKKEQKTTRGYVVAPVSELMSPDAHRHGGIKDGTCAGCHNAHGSNQQLFLAKHYSKIFYQKFAPAQYELCFSCHDVKLVSEEKTSKITSFRNGERNLHTVHVRDTKDRGENCRVCHNTHAGEHGTLVRDIIKYGTWQMPVRYKKSPTGGSCYPGCHPNYGYDRNQPIKNVLGSPTTMPAIERVVAEAPSAVELSATDVNGAAVRIPDGSRATVIALVRTDQPVESTEAIKLLEAAISKSDARVIIMVAGPNVAQYATTLSASLASSPKYSIVTDAHGALSSELDVRVFPITLVLRPDGLEIARLSGTVETLPLKLPIYLQLAAGKLDVKAATTQLSTHEVVGDPKVLRDLRIIERLIQSNKPNDALEMLMKLPDGAIPPWQYNLLGCKALMQLNRWADAKEAALSVVEQHPALPDAHFTLGQIYEHEGEWPKAAAEYRLASKKNEPQMNTDAHR